VNVRVRIRIMVSCVPVQCRRWNMKCFRKLILLTDEQLAPCCGIVISQTLRVLTMQGIDDRPDVAVVRGQVVHRHSQVRIFFSSKQTVCAMLFRAGARGNVTQIAVFGLKILHMRVQRGRNERRRIVERRRLLVVFILEGIPHIREVLEQLCEHLFLFFRRRALAVQNFNALARSDILHVAACAFTADEAGFLN